MQRYGYWPYEVPPAAHLFRQHVGLSRNAPATSALFSSCGLNAGLQLVQRERRCRLRGLQRLEKPWKGGLELLLCSLRKAREDPFQDVLEQRRNTVIVPLLVVVLGVDLVVVAPLLLGVHVLGSVCTAAFSTTRLCLHDAPIEDPSAAKLSGALGPAAAAVRNCLLFVRHFATVSLAAIPSTAFTNQPRFRMHGGQQALCDSVQTKAKNT